MNSIILTPLNASRVFILIILNLSYLLPPCFIQYTMKKVDKIVSLCCNLVILGIIACVVALSVYSPAITANNNIINGCVYAGNTKSNKVSLMINVYWGSEYIEPILKVLEEKNVKCTFFVGGTWVKDNPDLLKKIYNAGHEIASHGYNHKEHGKLTLEQNLTEMQKTHALVKEVIGYEMTLFAPPGGSYNKATVQAAESLNYTTIMWTRDTIDWRDQNASIIYDRATKNMAGGDLILMHPKEKTLEALPNIIDYALKQKLVVTTVSDTIAESL